MQMHIIFLVGKCLYDIVYGAPPSEYDRNLKVAETSIQSFIPTLSNLSPEEELKHFIAAQIRTARLNIELGDKKRALELINKGLQRSPENKTLIELRQKIIGR